MYPYLNIGPMLIQTSGLAVLLGVWLAAAVSEREAVRLKLKAADVYNLLFVGLAIGVVGARLAYALRFWSAFASSPLSLFSLNISTLSGFEGLVFGILAAALFAKRKNLPLRPLLDALAPGLAVYLVAMGLAHILSGSAYGSPATVPWSVYLWSEYRHPTQIYETVLALGVLVFAWLRPLGRPGMGLNFLGVVALSALSRIFLEAFRGDSYLITGGLRLGQLAALVVLAVSLWMIHKVMSEPLPSAESEPIEVD